MSLLAELVGARQAKRLAYADLISVVVVLDDRERRGSLDPVARLLRRSVRRELRRRERVTEKANRIYRG